MAVLVTGYGGQVGYAVTERLRATVPVIATDLAPVEVPASSGHKPVFRPVDLADEGALRQLVRDVRPALIIHPGAYTNVDKAESDEAKANAVNGAAPGILAEEAARLGIPLIHISTDYVFDGASERPWKEDDRPAPLNAYGRSKLAGERAVAAAGGAGFILRSSWIFSARGQNFVKTMLRLGRERSELKVVADQIGAPTSAGFLATVITTLASRLLTSGMQPPAPRLFHVACAGETSWHGFAVEIFRQARSLGMPLQVRDVIPIPSEAYPSPARRPKNSRLDCSLARQVLGIAPPTWQAELALVLRELAS